MRTPATGHLRRAYWGATAVLFAGVGVLTLTWTPTEATMGPVQKIFYLHLPVAINTFAACLIVFVASVGFLWQRNVWWDDLASAGAKVSVQLCTVVLASGMIWGKSAWGHWWTWSPRLTFSLALWLLYAVYLIVRVSVESRARRAAVAAVYGVVAFLDVPLVYLSARLMPDIHPSSVALAPAMKLTLALWFAPVTLLSVGLVVAYYAANRRRRLTTPHAAAEGGQPMRLEALGDLACYALASEQGTTGRVLNTPVAAHPTAPHERNGS